MATAKLAWPAEPVLWLWSASGGHWQGRGCERKKGSLKFLGAAPCPVSKGNCIAWGTEELQTPVGTGWPAAAFRLVIVPARCVVTVLPH